MKSLFSSKVFWVAVIQAVVGVVVVSLTQLDMVGYVAIVKSIADVILRLVTTEPVTLQYTIGVVSKSDVPQLDV